MGKDSGRDQEEDMLVYSACGSASFIGLASISICTCPCDFRVYSHLVAITIFHSCVWRQVTRTSLISSPETIATKYV